MNTRKIPTYYSLDEWLSYLPDDATNDGLDVDEEMYENYKGQLNAELKTTDRIWLQFHAGQCEQFGKAAKTMLYRIVKSSVEHPENSIAAANAITILKIMGVSLSSLDLEGVRIPGADLSRAILDDTNLYGAELKNVNLTKASLNRTYMYKADLTGVELGINSSLNTASIIRALVVSPNKQIVIIKSQGSIKIWDIKGKNKEKSIPWETSSKRSHIDCIDDNFFIVGDKKGIYIYSISSLEKIETIKRDNVQPGKSSYLNFALSPNKKLLIIAKPHENSTEITVREKIIRKDTGTPSFCKVIHRIDVPNHINEIFFPGRNDVLATINSLPGGKIELRNPVTLQIVEQIENRDGIKLCDFMYDKSIISLIHNKLFAIRLKDDFSIDSKKEITTLLEEDCRIKSVRYISKNNCIAYIKDNIDSYPSICILNLKDWPNTTTHIYDAFDPQIDDIYISKDELLLYQVSYETGKIYSQTVASIIAHGEPVPRLSFLSSIYFSNNGERIFAIGKKSAISKTRGVKSSVMYTYRSNSGFVSSKKIPIIMEEEKGQNEIAAFNYSLSGNAEFIIQSKHVLNEFDEDQEIKILQSRLRLLRLDDTNSKTDTFNLDKGTTTATAVSYDGKYLSCMNKDKLEIWNLGEENKVIYASDKDRLNLVFNIEQVSAIAISCNFSLESGGYIAFSNGRHVVLLELEANLGSQIVEQRLRGKTRKLIYEIQDDQICNLRFTKNGKRLIALGKCTIHIYDVDNSYKGVSKLDKYKRDEEEADVEELLEGVPSTLDISLDGKYFLTCNQGDTIITDSKRLHHEEKYNILRFFDITTGKKICKKEVIPGTIGVKFSPTNNLFVTWEWKGDSVCMWHYTERTFRLLWKNGSHLEAHKLDITKAKGLNEYIKERLIYAGAIERLL